MNGDEDLG